ncbi:peroxiredoxin (alkyl hydroperoxide reductase subunit C) [Balneicella halophila]|uniref:Thioredoxin peroxidase n=1 Tax=Balneicella halophila TaxID=1537566 RepID=A0A7L4US69_BALHA|nr:peroxiredoxin [Balneicella halophila]PVX51794.1 peroxiredoxin (alkyl hydroperoxide reductase subunit C) [Balneicella halophila]
MRTLVGKKFPNLTATAIDEMGDNFEINILEEATKNNKKVLLFWWPKDFTFVCPTELHAFQAAAEELKERNTILVGASCDTAEVHFAWLNTEKDNGGISGVKYPLIADSNRNLAEALGILDSSEEEFNEETQTFLRNGDSVTYRATFLIDEEGKVFHESINDMPLGRNVSEYLRLIDAYAHVQTHGEVCPANWERGQEAMKADRDGVASYLSKH